MAKKENKGISLEKAFEQLEDVIERLQDNEISLEDAFKEYENRSGLWEAVGEIITPEQLSEYQEIGPLSDFLRSKVYNLY